MNMEMSLCSGVFLAISCLVTGNVFPNNVVETKYGQIQGLNVTVDNKVVYNFLKVPYAKPPLGDLRFRKPQPLEQWSGLMNGTKHGPACIQKISSAYKNYLPTMETSEDCLTMNIYIPGTVNMSEPLPIMVYIHGGGYYTKSSNLYDGSRIAAAGDVIVILINYRLGMFGFLSTEDDNSKGNYGMWDQIAALKWIRENARSFGGNPEMVTVFGHSAGGYSIGLHLLSKHSRGLFRRAIAMSGFGVSKRAINHGSRHSAVLVGIYAGCYGNHHPINDNVDTEALVNCLRNKTAEEIRVATVKMRANYTDPDFIMRQAPVVDGEFLDDLPEDIIDDPASEGFKTLSSVDLMAGSNDADGWLLKSKLEGIETLYNFNLDDGVPIDAFCDGIIGALVRDYYNSNENIKQRICKMYLNNSTLISQGLSAIEMYGDMMYASPAVRTLRKRVMAMRNKNRENRRRSFHFLFAHQPTFKVVSSRRDWVEGAQHGDECWFIFRKDNLNYTEEELRLNEKFVRFLTNFAKYGNPNGASQSTEWPEFDRESEYYKIIDNTNNTLGRHLYEERIDFWLQTIPSLQLSHPLSAGTHVHPSCFLFIMLFVIRGA